MSSTLISRNPTTGETIRELPKTTAEELAAAFARARSAQPLWAALGPRRRARLLLQVREALIQQTDAVAALIAQENGKPRFEALSMEILPCLESLTFFAKTAPRMLRDRRIPLRLMKHRVSYLNYWPLGTVAVIAPWNYPLLLPFADIMMALVAGNTVIFKPSELTPLIGLKIQELVEQAGLPPNVLQTVIGDGELGSAILKHKPAKIFFTGSVATGKKIAMAAAENLIPVRLELGGKDAMIVLSDADLDFATSAAAWGGFANSGQTCASVERIYVDEAIAPRFVTMLKEKLGSLRHGDPLTSDPDLGSVTAEKQKDVYREHLAEAKAAGADFVLGGEFSANESSLQPTVLVGQALDSLRVQKEETFGPIVTVSTFRSLSEAIEKANSSSFGLTASVMTRNLSLGEDIARRLEAGTVTINEVLYTAGLPETPWGGVKDTGIGSARTAEGILDFVHSRHIHRPARRFLTFKAPWWFPYTPFQFRMFRQVVELYRRHWTDKLRAFPHVLWNALQFLKKEKRL